MSLMGQVIGETTFMSCRIPQRRSGVRRDEFLSWGVRLEPRNAYRPLDDWDSYQIDSCHRAIIS
jgi:hypothetical protein